MADPAQIDLEETVRQFVIEATGLDSDVVIYGNQSAPAPNGAYASVLAISVDQNGVDWEQYFPTGTEGELEATITGNREIAFSVQFYRQDTMSNARKVLQYAKTPNGKFLLQKSGLAWRRESPITQIDEVDQGNNWEKRAAITLNFGFNENAVQTINALGSAEITVEYSGETDIQEIINVTSS